MPAKTFLRRVNGITKEILATVISLGTANAGDPVALDDSGHLDASVMPVGYGADIKVVPASEGLSASNLVNLFLTGTAPNTVLNARKADASAEGKEANGFVLDAVASGQPATVYFGRKITGLSGLTVGARYYLGTTPGTVSLTPASGAGKVDQYIGKAVSDSEIAFEPDDYVVKAA